MRPLLFFGLLSVCFSVFNRQCGTEYMDELFHMSQTQQFSKGQWDYHPLISTPPGPYLLPASLSRAVQGVCALTGYVPLPPSNAATDSHSQEDEMEDVSVVEFAQDLADAFIGHLYHCSLTYVRATNLLYLPFLILVCGFILYELHSKALVLVATGVNQRRLFVSRKWKLKANNLQLSASVYCGNVIHNVIESKSVEVVCNPLLLLFAFLFYTEVSSALWLLFTHYLCISSPLSSRFSRANFKDLTRGLLIAVCAVLSLLHRQTNIVWLFFTGICCVERLFVARCSPLQSTRGFWKVAVWSVLSIASIIDHFWHLIFAALSFVLWVVFFNNGSIAIGDASHHQFSLHLAQCVYLFPILAALSCASDFCHFTNLKMRLFAFFFAPFDAAKKCDGDSHGNDKSESEEVAEETKGKPVPGILHRVRKLNAALFVTLCIVFAVFCLGFRIAHPFLLSDNRHYSFYVWRYFLSRDAFVCFVLSPLSALCAIFLYSMAAARGVSQWTAVWFALCSASPLCLSPLFEFRYFLLPSLYLKLLCDLAFAQTGANENHDENPVAFEAMVEAWNKEVVRSYCTIRQKPWTPLTMFFTDDLPRLSQTLALNQWLALALNAFVFYMFLFRPFQWVDGSVARFMW